VQFVFGDESLQRPEASAIPVPVPDVHALLVELVGLANVLQDARIVERVDLAGDDCERARTYARASGSVWQELRPGVRLIEGTP